MHSWVGAGQMIGPDNDGEAITLLFTMPPNKEAVWGIKRVTNYRAGHRPSTENVLAALGQNTARRMFPRLVRERRTSPGFSTTRAN